MRKSFTLLFLLCSMVFLRLNAQNCATPDFEEYYNKLKPNEKQLYEQLNKFTQDYYSNRAAKGQSMPPSGIVTIPIVVHIFHGGTPIGQGANISDQEVIKLFDIMTAHFNYRNNIPRSALNHDSSGIKFCLATKGPTNKNGTGAIKEYPYGAILRYDGSQLSTWTGTTNPTQYASIYPKNGIYRIKQGVPTSELVKVGKWDLDKYYNVYLVTAIDSGKSGTGGFANYPNNGSDDFSFMLGSSVAGETNTLFTHEVGHAFNLAHTFSGDGSSLGVSPSTQCPPNTDCNNQGDNVCDTPPHRVEDATCAVSNDNTPNSCVSGGQLGPILHNIMAYSNCPNVFSAGQVLRMRAVTDAAAPTTHRKAQATPTNVTACGCSVPRSDFYVLNQTVCVGVPVKFFDQSNQSPTSWNWSFPGASTTSSTQKNPQITYNATGTYAVTLIASNSNGAGTTMTKTGYIVVVNAQALPLNQDFESSSVFPPTGWSRTTAIANSDSLWRRTNKASAEGVGSFAAVLPNADFVYGVDNNALTLPVLNFTGANKPRLKYHFAYQEYYTTPYDSFTVSISSDCGQTFTPLVVRSKRTTPRISTAGFGSAAGHGANFKGFIPSSTQWKQEIIDLTSYTGQTNIIIKFERNPDNSGNKGATDFLYLDNIVVESEPPCLTASLTVPFTEDFEGATFPPIGWTRTTSIQPNDTLWSRSNVNATGAGTHSAVLKNTDYPNNLSPNALTLPALNLIGVTNPTLSFYLSYQEYWVNPYDTLTVYYSIDCGKTYLPTAYRRSPKTTPRISTAGIGSAATHNPNFKGFVPTNANMWRLESVDLSAVAGNGNVLIKIERGITNNSNKGATDYLYIDKVQVTGTTGACTYTIQPPTQSFSSVGGKGTISISAGGSCTWTASSSCSFVSISNASGTGPSTVTYTVAPNTSTARTCTLTIGGQKHVISQEAFVACSYIVQPPSNNLNSAGGNGTVNVSAASNCTWTATSSCSFVSIINSAGTGSTTISYTIAQNTGAARTCTITINGQKHSISQDAIPSCSYVVQPPSNSFTNTGGAGSLTLSTAANCTWTASSSSTFVSIINSSGTGPATVSYSLEPNVGSTARTCTITINGQKHTISQAATAVCSYSIQPTSQSFTSNGGNGTFSINTSGGCTWTAISSCSFVSITNSSGSGLATVSYSVAPNLGTARTCTITVNGQNYSITQAAPVACSYVIQPISKSFTSAASNSTINLNTASTCTWTAVSSCSFVNVINSTGTGSAIVSYTIEQNTGVARTCTITINGQNHAITQSAAPACSYVIQPNAFTYSSQGGNGSFALSTAIACSWTATSSCSFVSIANNTGTGSATVSYSIAPNIGALRTCTITINGQRHAITQQAAPACSYAIQPPTKTFTSASGSGEIALNTASTCSWSASSSCSFVSVINSNGTGSATISYTISQNTGAARTCTITINGQRHAISQSAAPNCSYAIQPASQSFNSAGGSGLINVSTSSVCSWTATSSCTFVNISNPTGTGSGTINYSVAMNTTAAARTCTITINGQKHVINQDAGSANCTYNVQPPQKDFNASVGASTISVSANPGCTWTATSSCGFVSILNSTGSGNGTVTYTIEKNTGLGRTCTITIAGIKHYITQEGGSVDCTPTFTPQGEFFTSLGGNGSFVLNIPAGCTWTAFATCSYVQVNTLSGTGSAVISYSVAPYNNSVERRCEIVIAGFRYSIYQEKAFCDPSATPTSASVGFVASNGQFVVSFPEAGCSWTATSDCSFVSIVNPKGTSTSSVSYTLTANTSTQPRTCEISVNGVKVHTIVQEGKPSGILDANSDENLLMVIPNPVINKCMVYGHKDSDLVLYDPLGKLMLKFKANTELDLSHLAKGVYFIKEMNSRSRSLKIVIQ